MSNYDYRDRPAYPHLPPDLTLADNPNILSWWTPEHDAVLESAIREYHWGWYWSVTNRIVEITPPTILETWKKSDPCCKSHVWYNAIMYFAQARAEQRGLTKDIREPKWRKCLLCGEAFIENSLPQSLVQRLGIDRLEFCAPCLRDRVLQGTGKALPEQEVIAYLQKLAGVLQRVPHQDFGAGIEDLLEMPTEERVAVLTLLTNKPTVDHVSRVCGSWLKGLIKAGVLEGDAWRTSRGVRCMAKDGHECNSLAEKTIDDFLSSRRVSHKKEPPYPGSNYRGDFLVGEVFIEYFGLMSDSEYAAKAEEKSSLCKKHGLLLIAIYPEDLVHLRKLERKLLPVLEPGTGRAVSEKTSE